MKTLKPSTYYFLFFILLFVFSCSNDEESTNSNYPEGINLHPEPQQPVVYENLIQFTPNQADWSTFYAKTLQEGFTHDPDGWRENYEEKWEKAKWDGTIYNPTTMSREDFYCAICPDDDIVRGIREVFYETKPFKDNAHPTKAEVDEWHRISIKHLRSLVGYDYPIKKDSCLFIKALWADQRKYSDTWDAKYGVAGCNGNIHCGGGFIPDENDQQPYLAEGAHICNNKGSQAEGVFVRPRAHIPWSIKWIRPFCFSLKREGFWGGHLGPWWRREKFGFNYWDLRDMEVPRSYAPLRAKWSGELYPHLYEKPQ